MLEDEIRQVLCLNSKCRAHEAAVEKLAKIFRSKAERSWVMGGGSWLRKEDMKRDVDHILNTLPPTVEFTEMI